MFGEITVFPGPQGKVTIDPTQVESYDHNATPTAQAKPSGNAAVADAARIDAAQTEVPAPHEATAVKKSRGRRAK
jgi:hypothetical protein